MRVRRQHISWGARLYLLQLVVGIGVGTIVYNGLAHDLGSSLALDRLARGYDRAIIDDWIREYSHWLRHLQPLAALMILAYLTAYCWWLTAYLRSAHTREMLPAFWSALSKVAIASILTIVGIVSIAALCLAVPLLVLGDPTQQVSERPYVLSMIAALIVAVTCSISIWIPMLIAKYQLATRPGLTIYQAILQGWQQSWMARGRQLRVILTAMLILVGLSVLGHLAGIDRGAPSWVYLTLVILIQQAILLARAISRAWAIDLLTDEV